MAKQESITINVGKAVDVGNNVKLIKQDDMLILVIDEFKEVGASSTGKMMGVASTGGFVKLPNGMKMNLYLGRSLK